MINVEFEDYQCYRPIVTIDGVVCISVSQKSESGISIHFQKTIAIFTQENQTEALILHTRTLMFTEWTR